MTQIVFDLDGTLVHSAPDIRAGVNIVMEQEGLPPFTLKEITSFIGNGLPKLVERVVGARALNMDGFDDLYGKVSAAYDSVNGNETALYPGVEQVLDILLERGHRLGVCTNKPLAPTQAVLDAMGISDRFLIVIGGDSLTVKKPDPEPLLATFAAMGGGGVYVGDSEVDAATAKAARIPFVLFTEGYRKTPLAELPHHENFSDWRDVPRIVADLLGVPA